MSDDEIGAIVKAWRVAHPATKRLWYDVEGAVRSAVRAKGESFEVRGLLRIDTAMGPDSVEYTRIRLPSGRYLCYRNMHINADGQLVYEGINQFTRKWELLETYYGKLVENIVQAVARDVFMTGMRKAEEAGYAVVLRVHDELVCEVPDDPSFTHEGLAGMMADNPSWSIGLPLSAAGFEAYRYRKE
jgi:DNA polymerase